MSFFYADPESSEDKHVPPDLEVWEEHAIRFVCVCGEQEVPEGQISTTGSKCPSCGSPTSAAAQKVFAEPRWWFAFHFPGTPISAKIHGSYASENEALSTARALVNGHLREAPRRG
jgi:hypothetical protein